MGHGWKTKCMVASLLLLLHMRVQFRGKIGLLSQSHSYIYTTRCIEEGDSNKNSSNMEWTK